MKKLPLLAIGAAALAVAGFSPAAFAGDRGHVSFGIYLGGPVVETERDYDPAAYWAQRRWEHRRWEAYQRRMAHENWERERAEQAYYAPRDWHHDRDCDE